MALRCTVLQLIHPKLSANIYGCSQPIRRYAGYKASPLLEDIEEPKISYEISKDPEEWKYVERALPLTVIPEPVARETYPSGWKPQSQNIKNRHYFIERTKNHMIPVYLHVAQRGVRRNTIIKRVQGDINLLERDLVKFLQKESFKPIRSQVNELSGYIRISGDFVNATKYFLEKKQL